MADNETDPSSSKREPIEHSMADMVLDETFSLQKYVMDAASMLPYYWPDYTADMTQQALQGPGVESGTYILRPTGGIDPAKRRFLTLSVRMDFQKESVNVWHFPVIIEEDKVEDGKTACVHFSLTHNPSKITSLHELMSYYHGRPLRGSTLPSVCYVKKGLVYQSKRQRKYYTEPGISQYVDTTIADIIKVAPVPPQRVTSGNDSPVIGKAATLPQASSSIPIVPPRTLPRTGPGTPTLTPNGTPRPTPRFPKTTDPLSAPTLPPRPETGSSHSSMSDSLASSDGGDDFFPYPCQCKCGIPKNVTALPGNWTVHRSLEGETKNMLYFRDPTGQTAWALPPRIDRECKKREYLEYGRLNIRCFELYSAQLKYLPSSELANYSKYEIYSAKSNTSKRI